MGVTDGFADALMQAPLGVALLAALEGRVRDAERFAWPDHGTSPSTVDAAVEHVEQISFGDFLDLAVFVGYVYVGPWNGDAAPTLATAYRYAANRRPIAEAIARRFGDQLHRPMDPHRQQWWSTTGDWQLSLAPLFVDYERVYDPGQFTWAGLWTVTEPPAEIVEQLTGAWEMDDRGPISVVDLPVLPEARVFEIHREDDWATLVQRCPKPATDRLGGWELPGVNQRPNDLAELIAVPGQRGARLSVRDHLVPDWRSVAGEFDGVHLSWAGWLTSDGCITDLGDGDVTMLRFWFSERTHWLHDVFGEVPPSADRLATLLGRA